jgi:hypothetical protein
MGLQFHAHIDHSGQIRFAEERAHVNVAQLQDAEPIEPRRETGNEGIDFAHTEPGALNQRAVADGHQWRGHG